MNSIYVHLNPKTLSFSNTLKDSDYVYTDLPEFANISIKQTKKFLNTDPIVITNDIVNEFFKEEINQFFTICKSGFPSFANDPFWLTTLLRLYVVFLYSKKFNLTEFIHLEYDNLIYSDLKQLKTLPSSLYFTRVGPFCSSAGFVYCNSLENFEQFISRLIKLFNKGEKTVCQFTQYSHLSEMILIDLIYSHTTGVIDYLPILPVAPGNDNFEKIDAVFDCASYGQYLGGTNNGDGKGWHGQHHYIGQQISNKNIEVLFDKTPYIIYNNKKIPILNLHIHSKKLENFIEK